MRALIIGLIVLTLAGCAGYASPKLAPGPAALQQGRAVVFDPYPDPTAGPEIVGGRPLGYTAPQAETVEAQQWRPPHVLR